MILFYTMNLKGLNLQLKVFYAVHFTRVHHHLWMQIASNFLWPFNHRSLDRLLRAALSIFRCVTLAPIISLSSNDKIPKWSNWLIFMTTICHDIKTQTENEGRFSRGMREKYQTYTLFHSRLCWVRFIEIILKIFITLTIEKRFYVWN